MKNTEIKNQLNNLTAEHIARLVGIVSIQVSVFKTAFYQWLSMYTGFETLGNALSQFIKENNLNRLLAA